MKKTGVLVLVFVLCLASGTALYAQDESGGPSIGVQVYSDSFAGILYYSRSLELGLKAKVSLYDDSSDALGDLKYGGHLAYQFQTREPSTAISLGFEAGSYLGDISYVEYIDVGLRIGFNYRLGKHALLSGLLYPLYITTRETEAAGSFSLQATLPKAALALAYLF